jgi:hypothetical protein
LGNLKGIGMLLKNGKLLIEMITILKTIKAVLERTAFIVLSQFLIIL